MATARKKKDDVIKQRNNSKFSLNFYYDFLPFFPNKTFKNDKSDLVLEVDNQGKKKNFSGRSLNIKKNEPRKLDGEVMGECRYELNNPYGQNPYGVQIEKCSNLEELLIQIRRYAETQTSLKLSTIQRDINYLRLLSDKNQAFPVDLFNPRVEQWIYHMTWYKNNVYDGKTNKNFYGLKQRKEAFYLYLDACGIPTSYFPYELPNYPKSKPVEFPNPDIAYQMTTYDYFDDKELNWFFQFTHLYNLIVGPRAPSELTVMKISDIDFDTCTIKFCQPKLNGKSRKILLPEAFIKGKTRKSIKNFIEYHRNEITNQYSGDFLFISPWSGKPFSPANMGKYLSLTGKKVYSSFTPYNGRHFCATGKLIQKWIEKHPDPIEATKNFMGHDRRKTTEKYTALAEEYYSKYPYNWFKRILKDRYCRGKYAKKSKQRQKTSVSHGNPPRDDDSPGQIRTGD